MSRLLVVLCHPNPKSYNHAVARTARERLEALGHRVVLHDLYEEGFDPVLRHAELRRRLSFDDLVQRHYHDLEQADGLVVVHPEWWSQPPALLKGWIDRVLMPGVGYEFEGEEFMPKNKVALLGGKRALVLATTDAERPSEDDRPDSVEPLLAAVWRATLSYCGIVDFHFRMLHEMHDLEAADRREWLESVASLVEELYPPTSSAQ